MLQMGRCVAHSVNVRKHAYVIGRLPRLVFEGSNAEPLLEDFPTLAPVPDFSLPPPGGLNALQHVLEEVSVVATRLEDAHRATHAVSYTHLRAHETRHDIVCRLLLE